MRKAELVSIERPLMPVAQLREHQQEALLRYRKKDEVALFFEMGCGKSLTLLAIAEDKFKNGEIDGLLVIAPNDVHRQWYDELVYGIGEKMWCEALGEWRGLSELSVPFQAQCYGGRGGADKLYPFYDREIWDEPSSLVDSGEPRLAVKRHKYFWFLSVNVDTFSTKDKWRPVVQWANEHRIMIAVDEATVIKNPKTLRSQRILYEFNHVTKSRGRIIRSEKLHPWRAVLTGTPVTNGPVDLWSIMEFLRPNYFGMNWWTFRDYYAMFTEFQGYGKKVNVMLTEKTWKLIKNCVSYDDARYKYGCSEDTYFTVMGQSHYKGPYKHADDLKKRLEPVASFRLLTECEEMPAQNYAVRHCGMSPEQSKLYKQAMKEMAVEYKDAVMTAQNVLVLYLRLQQISSGFVVNSSSFSIEDDGYDVLPGEAVWIGDGVPKLDALMRDVDEAAKPVLILTRYTAEAEKIYNLCKERYATGLYTGWKVDGGVDAFKDGQLEVLVANSQKICRGFNLQMAHTTLFYSNTFSMEVRQQAEFRTFRLGQRHPCLYVDYIASPVDEKIMESLKIKKNLLDYIRGGDSNDILSELKEA